jgi:hypothetical protein
LTIILSILRFSSASVQADDGCSTVAQPIIEEQQQSLPQTTANDSSIRLYQVGQCPLSPKPECSDPNCQGVVSISPMQYQCKATTVFYVGGRDVTLTGCRCCPLPIFVWCLNYDCRAPTGTRHCISDELEGCACETSEDRSERFWGEFRVEDMPVLSEGEVVEDLIEINTDGDDDVSLISPSASVIASSDVSTQQSRILQEHEAHSTGAMALPTLGFNQQQFQLARDAQVDILGSF